jgi:hypothetical protein
MTIELLLDILPLDIVRQVLVHCPDVALTLGVSEHECISLVRLMTGASVSYERAAIMLEQLAADDHNWFGMDPSNDDEWLEAFQTTYSPRAFHALVQANEFVLVNEHDTKLHDYLMRALEQPRVDMRLFHGITRGGPAMSCAAVM